jgi:PAS domain S-box-containing protein
MTRIPAFRLTTLSLAVLSLVLVGFGFFNYQQRGLYQAPDDGVGWMETPQGVTAWIVHRGGPADRAGIHEGDLLKAINGQPITTQAEAGQQIYKLGVWSLVSYSLTRNGEPFDTSLVLDPQTASPIRNYLALVGLLYLLIGTFILFRRWTARKSRHFYVFCLASFVLYTFAYTGKFNLFDETIYWLNVAAWVLQPALFLHFCLTFPERSTLLRDRRYLAPLLYLPGALLGAIHVLVAMDILVLPLPLAQANWLVNRIELFYLGTYFLAGAVALHYAYIRATDAVLKHQLKWVTRGTWVAIVPFVALYALPYFAGYVPNAWMNASALSLAVLPVTFAYAIVRYRMMDVDILFRRGISYTLATASIVGLYFGLIALFADFFRATFPPINSRGAWVVVVVVTVILSQPVVNYIQQWVDRFFNPERYDYRRTLLEFARELTSELHVDRLLEQISDHLSETLGVDRLAVFLAAEPNSFRLVRSRGMNFPGKVDTSFLDPTQPALAKGYLFFDSVKRPYGFSPAAQKAIEQLKLHYYLPFKVKERTLGYLGLGKTREGDFLSSEDIDLLQTIAGYVSIALENASLYESLETRARDYQALRDFSQNIIESINAGVLACNLEGVVEAWNSALERLYGISRSEALGRTLEAIFPPELRTELSRASDPHHTLNLYKFRLRNAEDRALIVNLSVVPLIGKENQVIGRLLIFTDLTERVNLEDQLMQAEKLSSIGLLAAGVAHEVNTPLAVITSNAQMLMRQMDPEDPRTRTLDKIIAQAFRASEIANNLLKFSRVGGSEYSDLDVNRVITESLSLVEPMLKAARITVHSQLKTTLPAVYGNSGKLQQVFMNLIMNARDAMPRGGELTIATEAENSTVHVEVSDNGTGIPADHLNKIFDPFFTTKATSRGTGLGLAVTYGIIREHSGSIQVDSVVGRGTTFRLEFPAVRKPVNVS